VAGLEYAYDVENTDLNPRGARSIMGRDRHLLAIDQGTTSSRAVRFDTSLIPLHAAQQEIALDYPQPGWVQQDASTLWDITLDVTKRTIAASDVEVAAIGITNQRETAILWDRVTGEPIAPAINWQSRETAPLVSDLISRGMGETYQRITGLVPDAYFSATKIAVILDRDPELRRRAEAGELAFGTVDSWLIWKLTGGATHVTDRANASRTMLYDIRMLSWSDALLADLNIPKAILPNVVDNATLFGETDPAVIGSRIPITGCAGDQQSALFGQRCFSPGQAKNTYGTGSFLLMQTGLEATASTHRMLTTIAWGIEGSVSYALEGAIFVTGAAVQWLRDGLGIIERAQDIEPLARSVETSDGVTFVPALAGLGAPWWDADARGTIAGLTRGSTKAHIARATLEAIAFQTRDSLDAMQLDSGIQLAELRVDGGASANDLLMQIQANVLGVPVIRPKNVETTVCGAAALAGLGAGIWSSIDDIAGEIEIDRQFDPEWSEDERESAYATWQTAVQQTLSDR
jgi:glycerol kinase